MKMKRNGRQMTAEQREQRLQMMCDSLIRVAHDERRENVNFPLRAYEYRELATNDDYSESCITNTFKSWNEALKSAGLPTNAPRTGLIPRGLSGIEIMTAITRFFREFEFLRADGYAFWCMKEKAPTLRVVMKCMDIDSWPRVIEVAQKACEDSDYFNHKVEEIDREIEKRNLGIATGGAHDPSLPMHKSKVLDYLLTINSDPGEALRELARRDFVIEDIAFESKARPSTVSSWIKGHGYNWVDIKNQEMPKRAA